VSDVKRTQTGLSPKTLLIAGAASATAAIVIPMLWRPGTVFAAAMTPIVVALVTELLHRPVETVSAARGRRPRRGDEVLDQQFEEPFDPLAPPSAEELDALPRTTASTPALHKRKPLTGRQWKLALTTGLAAFAIVAAVLTASELVAGDAVSGGERTTFFGGSDGKSAERKRADEKREQPTESRKQEEEASPAATTDPEATPTAVPTVTPTVTPGPTASAVPAEPTATP
jgi:hypothetical protein